jgi:signal transduction histidine kinase
MKNTSSLETLPRYIYGIITVVTVLALLLVGYIYVQEEKISQLERRLTTFHLPTIVALNVIDRELNEIEKNVIHTELSAVLQAAETDVQHSGGGNRYQASGHLHLINSRLGAIRNWQRGKPGIVFESSTEQLQASIRRLESTLEEVQGTDPDEADRIFAGALKRAQNLVEQLRRLHLKESAKLGDELLLIEQSSARNIGGAVVLAVLMGGVVVGRLVSLLRSSLAHQRESDAKLHEYRDHLEELVAERSRELQASNRELESYSYSIAHDLRTPLRAVTSFSQILQEEAADKLDNEEKQSLERIVKASKYMAQLIDDILELSRISRTRLESDRFDLSRLARDIASRLDIADPDRHMEWRIQDGLKVRGSRLLLEVSLDNLFGNALKYTENVDLACIEFGAIKHDGEIVYFVKDNGIGFDMQYADKLFKPFQRLETSGDYSGTGVGLATVERVIRRHGGNIWAESEEGGGATFLFNLPS